MTCAAWSCAERGEPHGQVLLGDALGQVEVVDTFLLESHQNAPFDLDEADLAAGAVEAGQFLVDDPDEAWVDDLEALAGAGPAAIDQAPQTLAFEGLDPATDRVGRDTVLDDLAGQDAPDPHPVDRVLEGELARHGLDPLGQADPKALAERIEGLPVAGHERMPVAVRGEDLQHHLELEQDLGADRRSQAAPPRLQRQVDRVQALVAETGDGELVGAHEVVLPESVLDGDAVPA
jgi:hypothetical protein